MGWENLTLFTKILMVILISGNIFGLIFTLYQVYISLPIFKKYKNLTGPEKPYNKFAIVISAHDEEKVIKNLLDSLNTQNYPKDKFDIFLIADNCTDNTAKIAAELGANVYERLDPEHKSKGYALNWFFDQFIKKYNHSDYDLITIIDSDNVMDENYLLEMNKRYNYGDRVIIGYRIGKNPSATIWSNANSLFWIMQKRGVDHPRYMSGRSLTSVGGTGFAFAYDIIDKQGWKTQSLTEDLEFTMDVNLKGETITYSREAKFYDEQPEDMISTIKQRWRWSYGLRELLEQKSRPLLKSVFFGRTENLDSFMFSIMYVVLLVSPVLWVLSMILIGITLGLGAMLKSVLISALIGEIVLSLFIYILTVVEDQHWEGQWKGILFYPIYLLIISLTIFMALGKKPGWKKIDHSDQSTISDMNVNKNKPKKDSK